MSQSNITIKINIKGVIQGVGFRPFIYNLAKYYNINGYVLNKGNIVEIIAEGDNNNIKKFLYDIKKKRPKLSIIENIDIEYISTINSYKSFEIQNSTNGYFGNSIIPSDISICENCIDDIFNEKNTHYLYPFTNCTNCGPRYSIIKSMPYDRKNTTMDYFNLCNKCKLEYSSKNERRFYAQGISCNYCGPKHILLDKNGIEINNEKNILKKVSELIDLGFIIATKSDGGFNLICNALNKSVVKKLRFRLNRMMQPFAILCDSISTAKEYCIISKKEKELLTSKERPIVVCNKKRSLKNDKNYESLDIIAPGLHNIGLILPYNGTHILLFHYLKKYNIHSLIDTSANIPGNPMIIENNDALCKLKNIADFFLIHNRKINNRVDDSVMRIVSKEPIFLRRSRGFVPNYIEIPFKSEKHIIGLGSELNNTIALSNKNKVYLSQHIGNTRYIDTNEFHLNTIKKYSQLLGISPEIYVTDLHPNFNTTKTGLQCTSKYNLELKKIQHHYAHICSLMADNKIDLNTEIIGIAIDGVGYGDDGTIWGGEILQCDYNNYKRIAHLKPQPIISNDSFSYNPNRMLCGILSTSKNENIIDDLYKINNNLNYKEINLISNLIKNKFNITYTSSMGRIYDALSSLFSICNKRTYEGEPAMKFESYLSHCKNYNNYNIKDKIDINDFIYKKDSRDIFDTTMLFEILIDLLKKGYKKLDVAKFANYTLIKSISNIAINNSIEKGINIIGVSGGVANNDRIMKIFSKNFKENKIHMIKHKYVPCGDGGISLGQVAHVAASYL